MTGSARPRAAEWRCSVTERAALVCDSGDGWRGPTDAAAGSQALGERPRACGHRQTGVTGLALPGRRTGFGRNRSRVQDLLESARAYRRGDRRVYSASSTAGSKPQGRDTSGLSAGGSKILTRGC
ncbi:hypothetical protein NDU88_004929 [Pleurodeles waltl]|uniref:Uncharacterized protein n=1 Tax=Pleurodeles waltl TaxID=8319 RepID=A0AAV7NKV4_PLEWA|nr:hypothetical protein NDU88_004929 [Pleurodeles waltl]